MLNCDLHTSSLPSLSSLRTRKRSRPIEKWDGSSTISEIDFSTPTKPSPHELLLPLFPFSPTSSSSSSSSPFSFSTPERRPFTSSPRHSSWLVSHPMPSPATSTMPSSALSFRPILPESSSSPREYIELADSDSDRLNSSSLLSSFNDFDDDLFSDDLPSLDKKKKKAPLVPYSDPLFHHQSFAVEDRHHALSSTPPRAPPQAAAPASSQKVSHKLSDESYSDGLRILNIRKEAIEQNLRRLRSAARERESANLHSHKQFWHYLRAKYDDIKTHEQALVAQRLEFERNIELQRREELQLESKRKRLTQPFPDFTPNEQQTIAQALNLRAPVSEILVTGFNINLTREDVIRLRDCQLLNDEIMNFYYQMILEIATCRVHVFNTFFFKLLQQDYSRVRTWTRRIDVFSFDKILIPIHLGLHWCFAVINNRDKRFEYYDSLNGRDPCSLLFKSYMETEHMDKKKTPIDLSDWQIIQYFDIPQQNNGYDCGVFSCQFARCSALDKPFNFKQVNMPYLRNRMIVEILQRKITTL